MPTHYEQPIYVSCIGAAIQGSGYEFDENPEIIKIVKKSFTISSQVIVEVRTQQGQVINVTV